MFCYYNLICLTRSNICVWLPGLRAALLRGHKLGLWGLTAGVSFLALKQFSPARCVAFSRLQVTLFAKSGSTGGTGCAPCSHKETTNVNYFPLSFHMGIFTDAKIIINTLRWKRLSSFNFPLKMAQHRNFQKGQRLSFLGRRESNYFPY